MSMLNMMVETSLASLALMDLNDGVEASPNFKDLAEIIGSDEAAQLISASVGLELKSPREAHYSIILVCASELGNEDLARRVFGGLKTTVGGDAFEAAKNAAAAVCFVSSFTGRDAGELQLAVVTMTKKIRDKIKEEEKS